MSTGFFEKDETEVIRGDETLPVSKSPLLTATCKECGLYKACKSPKMNPTGEGKKRILILGENPGKNEDEQGMQFVGKSGQLLRNILKDMNLDLDRDFWKTNATCCHSINNETPTALQVVACRSRVMQCIKEYDPLVIIPLGKVAMDSLVGYRMIGRLSGLSMIDWVGCQIPDQELKRWICPTWHPSFILRNDNNGKEDIVLKKQMTQCIKMAVSIADNNAPFYISNYLSDCYSIETMDEAIDIIKQYQKKDLFAFDYETTGKKPHREGHEIISVSISDGLFSFAFPFFNDRNFRDEWKKLMLGNAQKIAHNAKFEVIWTKNRAGYNNTEGYWPNNIVWDTMLAAHIMDNKKKVNLKFQLYKLLGMAGYDNDIDPYLEAVKKDEEINGANAFNRIKEAPLNKLLLYNAMDSLGTFKLWEYQSRRMNPELKKGVDLFTRGSLALSHVEDNGIQFDEVQSEKSKIKIDKKMNVLEDLVFESKELKKWDREKPFRVSATGDLTHLLFDILDYKCLDEDRTITKRPKADANTMEKYRNVKVVDLTLDWRKWAKIRDTYLKGLTKESVNGVIHTVYGLHNIETFRSGSSSPNLQNQNKRDEEAAKVTRSLLKPRLNHKLAEYDYHSLEAIVISVYHKDPKWIEYVSSDKNDMHRDMGAKIFVKPKEEITKKERFVSKNGFVFPTIYGSWYKNTGTNIWNSIEDETKKHLRDVGIKNLNQFIEHMKEIEEWFWVDQFPVAYEWKEKTIHDYEKNGYVDLYTGFRCKGPMSINQLLNCQTQGTAFHCLLWTLTNVVNKMEKMKMDSRVIGEVHDSQLVDINTEEEDMVDHLIWLYGTQKIREHWDWLVVPLNIEKSVSKVNGSWAELKEVGMLTGE